MSKDIKTEPNRLLRIAALTREILDAVDRRSAPRPPGQPDSDEAVAHGLADGILETEQRCMDPSVGVFGRRGPPGIFTIARELLEERRAKRAETLRKA